MDCSHFLIVSKSFFKCLLTGKKFEVALPAPDVVVVGTVDGIPPVVFWEYFIVEELFCFEMAPID